LQRSWDILGLVIGLSATVVFLSIFRAALSLELTVKASQQLHDRMAKALLRSKIEFFDTNPLGRILNRVSADVGSNDDLLPQTLFDFSVISFIVIGAVATTIAVLPFTLIAFPPLMWYFLSVRNIFVTSTRELKRLEGLARSPIFAMLGESLGGIATIRSNQSRDYFRRKFEEAHDGHTRAFYAFIAASRWVGFRMDALMFLFLTLVVYLAVLFQQQGWFNIDPAILGLSLSMLLQLAGLFQWCIRQSAEVVNQMVSVERVLEFGDLESEAPLKLDTDASLAGPDWPSSGAVQCDGLSVRYRATLPLALNHISFHIPGGSRVGIVGRTGSGKSTIVQTLFRLLEAEEGTLSIDGVDVSKLGLHALREKISVIPQMPTLFSGCSVRENLDLFGTHSDEDIQKALDDAHLGDVIASLPRGWDSVVSEGGSNFSVGQRQLLCLARAILSNNKVLVLDEATASVDRRTDEMLQAALQESFRHGTIIAVAHRLETIIDYDIVLVLGHGHVLEWGSPAKLLTDGGAFASMVNDTGDAMSADLRRRAFGKAEEQEDHVELTAATLQDNHDKSKTE
jgi:ATP-binding cassette, subfamily C (CFTR/MRP), member 4